MTDAAAPGRNSPRLTRIALLGSLGLNLFFAGWWFGGAMRPPPPGPHGMHDLDRMLRGRLSADGMSKVDGLLRQVDSGFRQQFGEMEAVRRQLHAILVTETFDSDAFIKALEALNANRAKFDSNMTRHIADIVGSLSAEDRRILADTVLSLPPGPLG
jgi:uncharacterized membrane protein